MDIFESHLWELCQWIFNYIQDKETPPKEHEDSDARNKAEFCCTCKFCENVLWIITHLEKHPRINQSSEKYAAASA